MGRRLNVSTPTVINTELVPLDESFYLDVDGQMEQWYYDNTEQYAPNRKVTPLLLTPVISAFDKDTDTSYTPAFNTTRWFAKEWNESQGKYVETEITNQVDSASADYVIQGNNLLVKKNVSYSHAVSIRCVATYIDPRDSGVTYTVEDNVNLTTNRTADVVFPEVDIISPSGRSYNPIVDDENSQYDFKGVTTNNPVQPMNTDVRRYPVDVDGTEEILNSGEAVAPIMDVRYGENVMTDQEFMYRQTAGGELVGGSIDKAYIERIKGNTIAWNQLVKNGNFKSTTNWTNLSSVEDGVGTSSPLGKYQGLRQSATLIDTHKYYVTASVKTSVDNGVVYLQLQKDSSSYVYGQINTNTDSFQKGSFILTSNNGNIYIRVAAWSGDMTIYVKNVFCIDLTLIYGAGNEPTTVEEFEADYQRWFGKPLSYEEYDEGSLRPVLMQSVKTTGFNQWDGSVFKTGERYLNQYGREENTTNIYTITDYIPVLPNTLYCVTIANGTNPAICFYDANKNFISGKQHVEIRSAGYKFTTPPNARYVRDSVQSADVGTYCINISNPSKNGTYEAYEGKVQGFDVTAIKGKLDGIGESVTIFPDGMKKAGNVQDEIFVDGGVVKAIKRVGSVDLGSLEWRVSTSAQLGIFFGYAAIANIKSYGSGTNLLYPSSCCAKYSVKTRDEVYNGNIGYDIDGNIGAVYIYMYEPSVDSASTTGTAFATAMNGVMLYYELAEPQTYVLDPITDFVWYGIKDGQEVLADTLPWYVSGQGTDNLVVDAMYGENINVVLRCKMMDGETLSPSKAYATLNWRIPDIETFVQSDKGGAVRGDTEDMTFDTIVNVNGDVLSDAIKQKHLAFNWKIRKNNTSTEIDKGWGQRITIDASELRNVKQTPSSTLASTLVSNEVYLKGAYEEVTEDGEVVTYNGEAVYDRPID